MSIASKFDAWAKSEVGKARMREKVEEYQRSGVARTKAGSAVISERRIGVAVMRLRQCLEAAIQDAMLPDSVAEHVRAMYDAKPIRVGDSWEVCIYFGGDLHRDSLDNDLPYEGVDNIVALFNNGYDAKDYVYGWWDGHEPEGEALSRSATPGENFAWVRSRKHRQALHFIQQAIGDFNGNYGAELNMTAVAAPVYEK